MLDSLFIGMSGLTSYSKGLKTISNNVTNLNTPGFKSSQLQFADLFYQGSQSGHSGGRLGSGVGTLGSSVSFKTGEFRSTGNAMDAAIDGQGMFVLRDDKGNLRYTKAGQFEFDKEGYLVNRSGGEKVLAYGENGKLTEISISGLRNNPPKATSEIVLKDSLYSDDTEHVISGVVAYDASGKDRTLSLTFKDKTTNAAGEVVWKVTVAEGATTLTTGEMRFKEGKPVTGFDSSTFTLSATGFPNATVNLKLGVDARGTQGGANSTLSIGKIDGYAQGTLNLAATTFDKEGRMELRYSNQQVDRSFSLAMARFSSYEKLEQVGGNLFMTSDSSIVSFGTAGNGQETIRANSVEISNVDLSQEFSDLILNQRGYQAASQVVGTANEMIQQLFDMRGNR